MRTLCAIGIVGLLVAALFMRCASVAAPQGGPRDTLPPLVVNMSPASGSVDFHGKRIWIEFDEFVTLKDQQKEFFSSPLMKLPPVITQRGRGIQIDIADTLLADQTYALHFGNAITDNNEGNPLSDFSFVFSTGTAIDSLFMSGWAVDAYSRDSVPGAFIFFYPATLPLAAGGVDSTLFGTPSAVARTHGDGLFIAQNLKPIDYRVYALQDANGNHTYDPGTDRVAFVDSLYNPERMAGFSIRYDTILRRLSPDPQLYFRMFMDKGFRRQLLKTAARPEQHRVDLIFAAEYPRIDSLSLTGIDPSRIIVQQLKPTQDSMILWLNVADSLLPDTLRGSITYHRHDSINRLVPHTQPLALVWRDLSHLAARNDTLPAPPANPFQMQVHAAQELDPYNHIGLSFGYPLVLLDSARVQLMRLSWPEGTPAELRTDSLVVKTPQAVRFVQDTLDMRRWTLKADWVDDARYELRIPERAFVDIAGQGNDSLHAAFHILPLTKFATLHLNVIAADTLREYLVEVTNSAGRVLRSFPHTRAGAISVPYLLPGMVRVRIVDDLNGNGRWDAGDLLTRRQPERAEIFSPSPESLDITLRENWSYDQTLDMDRIFTPVTTTTLREQLRQIAAQRLKAHLEALAKRQGQQQQTPNNQGMGFGNIGSNPLPF